MIAAERVAVVLLAAGLSTRFGVGDKLAAPLDGLALGLHAARRFASLPFVAKIAVVGEDGPDFGSSGFETVVNPDPGAGQSRSIGLGLAAALRCAPDAVLILLADMPFVTIAHIEALLAQLDADHPVVASTDGAHPSPPALFAPSSFALLADLTGDTGARALLRTATLVAASPAELADVDTPDDLRLVAGETY